MADGANINVKVGVTGADEGAAAISKLEKSLGIFTQTEEQLAAKRAGFLSAAEAEVAEINRESAALDRAEKELKKYQTAQAGAAVAIAKTGKVLKDHAETQNKVTKSGVQMGTGMQNVGYQVQDLAVQIGSGTSAFRAMGQQLPQLLSGFGPVGIAIGTISAVVIPLAGALLNTGESAEEAGRRAGKAAENLKKMQEAQAAIIKTQLDKSWKDFLTALDEQDVVVSRANIALTRRKELLEAINAAQDKLDTAKTAEDLAAVDADPNLSDAEKIARKAAITDKAAARTTEKEIGKVTGAADEAEAEVKRKQEAARVASEKVQAIRDEKEKEDAERKALEKSEKARAIAAKKIEAQQKVVDDGEFKTTALSYLPVLGTNYTFQQQEKQAVQEQALQDLKNKAQGNPKDPARLDALKERAPTTQSEFDARVAEEKAAREAANAAGLDAENKRKIADAVVPKLQETAAVTARQRQSQTNAGIVQVQQKAAQEQQKAAQKAAEEAGRRDIDDRQDKLNKSAGSQGLGLSGKPNATAQDVGKALSDGTNADELQKLGDQVREAKGKNGAALTNFLLQIIDSFNSQAQEIETMKRRMKNQ